MTRLESYLAAPLWAVEDIAMIVGACPSLAALHPGVVAHLWGRFSDEEYDASYMNADTETLAHFGSWLHAEVGG